MLWTDQVRADVLSGASSQDTLAGIGSAWLCLDECALTTISTDMQQAYEIQQEVLLMDTARIYRRGLNRPDLTLEDTKQVPHRPEPLN